MVHPLFNKPTLIHYKKVSPYTTIYTSKQKTVKKREKNYTQQQPMMAVLLLCLTLKVAQPFNTKMAAAEPEAKKKKRIPLLMFFSECLPVVLEFVLGLLLFMLQQVYHHIYKIWNSTFSRTTAWFFLFKLLYDGIYGTTLCTTIIASSWIYTKEMILIFIEM